MRIETNKHNLYIKGVKNGSDSVTLTCSDPISVEIISYTTDLNGDVNVATTGNNSGNVTITYTYSGLYLNGETYSGKIVAKTDFDSLEIPVIINCSDTLIYVNTDNGDGDLTLSYNSLPEVNKVTLVGSTITDISNRLTGEYPNPKTIFISSNERYDNRYVIAENGLSQVANEIGYQSNLELIPGRLVMKLKFSKTPGKNYIIIANERVKVYAGNYYDLFKNINVYENGNKIDTVVLDSIVSEEYKSHVIYTDKSQIYVTLSLDLLPYNIYLAHSTYPYTITPPGCIFEGSDIVSGDFIGFYSDDEIDIGYKSMFSGCRKLESIPKGIHILSPKYETNISAFLYSCPLLTDLSALNEIDLTGFTHAYRLFMGCASITDIPYIDTSSFKVVAEMFMYCKSLQRIPLLDATNWYTTTMMFNGCSSLTDLGGFLGLGKSINLSQSPLLTHESLINVINNLAHVEIPQHLILHPESTKKLTDDEIAIATNKGWILIPDYPSTATSSSILGKVRTTGSSEKTDIWLFVESYGYVTDVYLDNTRYGTDEEKLPSSWDLPYYVQYIDADKLPAEKDEFNAEMKLEGKIGHASFFNSHWVELNYVPNQLTTDLSECFVDSNWLIHVDGLKYWDVSKVKKLERTFGSCSLLRSIEGLKYWDVSNVRSVKRMFENCGRLEDASPISNWDMSNVTDVTDMFYGCINLENLPLMDATNWTHSGSDISVGLRVICGNIAEYCKITNIGGFMNLSCSFDLSDCPNLTHESLMNIINNLAPVTKPTGLNLYSSSKLSDDEIAIATNKGWTIFG